MFLPSLYSKDRKAHIGFNPNGHFQIVQKSKAITLDGAQLEMLKNFILEQEKLKEQKTEVEA